MFMIYGGFHCNYLLSDPSIFIPFKTNENLLQLQSFIN